MVDKNKPEDIYSAWYNLSNEFGKQFFEISKPGNFNYDALQESWKGYSEKMKDQLNKIMRLDENTYKDMASLWNEFTENMSSQLTSMNVYEKASYSEWYENWLDYTDRINREFSEVIQKQIQRQAEVFDTNELWMNKFGFNEEHKQMILDISQILSEYWLDVINRTTKIVKESITPDSKLDFNYKFQEFYDYLTSTNSNLIKRLMNTLPMENLKGYDLNKSLPNIQLMQDLVTNNLKYFDTMGYYGYNRLSDEIESIKREVDSISEELGNFRRASKSSRKK